MIEGTALVSHGICDVCAERYRREAERDTSHSSAYRSAPKRRRPPARSQPSYRPRLST